MTTILVCNTGTDNISKINIEDLSVEDISLGEGPIGPFSMLEVEEEVVVTNTYKNTLEFLNKESLKIKKEVYIGEGPKDINRALDKLIVTCSENNSLIVFDLLQKEIITIIRDLNYPYKIEVDYERNRVFICNLLSDRVDIFGGENFNLIGNIRLVGHPTDIKKSKCGRYLFITEDNLEEGKFGYINIYDIESFERIKKIKVGRIPSSIEEGRGMIYITNFFDGTINIIDLETLSKKILLEVGGMPICTLLYEEDLFICDYEKNKVIVLDKYYKMKKNIAVGREPNAMLIINPYH